MERGERERTTLSFQPRKSTQKSICGSFTFAQMTATIQYSARDIFSHTWSIKYLDLDIDVVKYAEVRNSQNHKGGQRLCST